MFKKIRTCLLLIIMLHPCSISNILAGVNDRIGGSGNNNNSQSSNDSNSGKTLLYVACGLAVAFVAYTIISGKMESTEEETDSTGTALLRPLADQSSDFTSKLVRYQEIAPVDIILGINSSSPYLYDRRFLVGLRFRL